MSQSALLTAVRDRLIQQLGYKLHQDIDVMPPPGRPPAIAGEKFIAVWGKKSSAVQNRALCERHEIRITVSLRGGKTPHDRWGSGIWLEATDGMEAVIRPIMNQIHGAGGNGIALLTVANTLISGDVDKFLTGVPLLFRDEIGPYPKSSSWWGRAEEHMAGLSSTLVFGYAERWQSLDTAT